MAACSFARLLPEAEVIAADGAMPLLDLARQRADRLGVRLATRPVALPEGLADLPPADLVWASGVVHHLPDPVPTLAGARRVGPRGRAARHPRRRPVDAFPARRCRTPACLARLEAIGEELVGRVDNIRPERWRHEGDWLRSAGGGAACGRRAPAVSCWTSRHRSPRR